MAGKEMTRPMNIKEAGPAENHTLRRRTQGHELAPITG